MIILIELLCIGKRYKINGYTEPKFLINVEGLPIIFWLLDNLNIKHKNIDYVYIVYNKEYEEYNFEKIIRERYEDVLFKFINFKENNDDELEIIKFALDKLQDENDKPIICIDGDKFFYSDIIDIWDGNNTLITFEDLKIYKDIDTPDFPYILDDYNSNILNIQDNKSFNNSKQIALSGAYGFSSFKQLYQYVSKVIDSKVKVYDKYHISTVIKYMIDDNIIFNNTTIENNNYFSLTTPEQLKEFEYVFLLDLDGTLVDTDAVYIYVWKELLDEHNIIVDEIYFENMIKGKSDKNFLKSIFTNITDNQIKIISQKKDELFIKNIEKIKVFENVEYFLRQLTNIRTAIVTNCNKEVALKILNYFNLSKYIKIVISSEDCDKTKPDKEPYLKAMSKLNSKSINKCIVFEDSLVGYTSAINANIQNIFLKTYDNKSEICLLNSICFNTYDKINVSNIINEIENKNIVKGCFDMDIEDIKEENIKSNAGYICDIIKYKILFNNNKHSIDVILKISNFNNSLSNTATKLELYKNEKLFYCNIHPNIKNIVNLPEFYGTNDGVKIGIVLQDLTNMDGCFNMDLNANKKILINIVDHIYSLHIKHLYYNYSDLPSYLSGVKTMQQYTYYTKLVHDRFDKFIVNNEKYFTESIKQLFYEINDSYDVIIKKTSEYPLSLCHGDLKSPNIFYKNYQIPYFLDFQYINLNKGISDIVFLLIESVDFNAKLYDEIIAYYYKKIQNSNIKYPYDEYQEDIRNAICIFPFFVMIWFNTENPENLVDKNFPRIFMTKLIKYYEYIFKLQ